MMSLVRDLAVAHGVASGVLLAVLWTVLLWQRATGALQARAAARGALVPPYPDSASTSATARPPARALSPRAAAAAGLAGPSAVHERRAPAST